MNKLALVTAVWVALALPAVAIAEPVCADCNKLHDVELQKEFLTRWHTLEAACRGRDMTTRDGTGELTPVAEYCVEQGIVSRVLKAIGCRYDSRRWSSGAEPWNCS